MENKDLIQERNEAIARFMGYKIKTLSNEPAVYDGEIPLMRLHHLKYNSDWNSLMHVIEKLTKEKKKDIRISFEIDNSCVCRIYHQDMMHDEPQFERGNFEPSIMNVFLAVSDCILKYRKPSISREG